jgi:hypothetical protein
MLGLVDLEITSDSEYHKRQWPSPGWRRAGISSWLTTIARTCCPPLDITPWLWELKVDRQARPAIVAIGSNVLVAGLRLKGEWDGELNGFIGPAGRRPLPRRFI